MTFEMIARNAGVLFFLLTGACIEPRNSQIGIDSGGNASPTDAGIGGNQPTGSLPDGTAGGPDRGLGIAGVDGGARPGANPVQPQQYNLTVALQGPGRIVGYDAARFSCTERGQARGLHT